MDGSTRRIPGELCRAAYPGSDANVIASLDMCGLPEGGSLVREEFHLEGGVHSLRREEDPVHQHSAFPCLPRCQGYRKYAAGYVGDVCEWIRWP